MKIKCKCGEKILDSTDFISNKGYIVPDQDLYDLENETKTSSDSVSTVYNYSKTIYQCNYCNRLVIIQNNECHFFSADEPDKSKRALRSVFGEKWKRHLRGHWKNDKGELWWGFGVEDQGYDSDIQSWDELSKRYYEVFERLKSNDLLRNSFIRKDGETVHKWPPKE